MSNFLGQGLAPNMASDISNMLAMSSGMGSGTNNTIGGGTAEIGRMPSSMNSVGMQPQVIGGIFPPHNSTMSANMGTGLQHRIPSMQGRNINAGLTTGTITGKSPRARKNARAPSQRPNQQNSSGLVLAAIPAGGPGADHSDGNKSLSGVDLVLSCGLSDSGDEAATLQITPDSNPLTLCRMGQETVQDIMARTEDLFRTLKTTRAPNGSAASYNEAIEKKIQLQKELKIIKERFETLRLIYARCNDNSQLQGMEYTHIESLIPMKNDWDGKSDERKSSESYRQAIEERQAVAETVMAKNRELKSIIDLMTRTIQEINTMMMMRRS